eukprot:13897348-Alexandrium_andersonii.AAC.1
MTRCTGTPVSGRKAKRSLEHDRAFTARSERTRNQDATAGATKAESAAQPRTQACDRQGRHR